MPQLENQPLTIQRIGTEYLVTVGGEQQFAPGSLLCLAALPGDGGLLVLGAGTVQSIALMLASVGVREGAMAKSILAAATALVAVEQQVEQQLESLTVTAKAC